MRGSSNDSRDGAARARRAPARRLAAIAVAIACAGAALPATAESALPAYRGVNLHSLRSDHSRTDRERELALAQALGANVVRVDVSWALMAPRGPRLSAAYVARLDQLVSSASRRRIRVLVVLLETPCWASSAPAGPRGGCHGGWWGRGVQHYPPRDPGQYAAVARWLTARYGTRLAALEVWNEPNDDTWRASDKAAAYARLLRATYPAAKAGNSRVPVLAGAIDRSDRGFLDALYANGIRGYEDGISIHPYTQQYDPARQVEPQFLYWGFVQGLNWIREGQLAAGDPTPIWLTEFGWTTGTGTPLGVSETQQAAYLVRALDLIQTLPYVRAAVVYNLRNDGFNRADEVHNYGLVTRGFVPKPAFWALRGRLRAG